MLISLIYTMVKMATFPKLVYRFSALLIKISAGFFAEIDKLILKFIQKCKGPIIAKTNLEKRNKFGGFTLSELKT